MPEYDLTCRSGTTYKVTVPDLSVDESRKRLRALREHLAEQSRLEARVQVIDKFYQREIEADSDDLDSALSRLDDLAMKSRLATEEVAAFADGTVVLQFFCDGVEGFDDMAKLPARDMMDLYERCRALMMGQDDPRGEGS